jgi:hypothetical protein
MASHLAHEGRVIAIQESGLVVVRLDAGPRVAARVPQSVDRRWLEAAVRVAPVEVAVALTDANGKRGALLGVFPRPEHADVVVEHELRATRLVVSARDGIELRSGSTSLAMEAKRGKVEVRGRDITSRASGINSVKGGAIRLN